MHETMVGEYTIFGKYNHEIKDIYRAKQSYKRHRLSFVGVFDVVVSCFVADHSSS